MQTNKLSDGAIVIDNAVYSVSSDKEMKTTINSFKEAKPKHFSEAKIADNDNDNLNKRACVQASGITHYFTLALLGALVWSLLWCTYGDGWRWDGPWFRVAAVAVIAWSSGLVLTTLTTLPPLLAALLTGILARYLGILDMRDYTEIDALLRKIYPVVILGKASLGWDVDFMRSEWKRVAALGVLPWAAEVAAVACCTHLLLGFPWLWGILLGSIYASVSCAVVMPSVAKHQLSGVRTRNWPQLVCTAGGVDTALSVGVYGLIYSFMFYETDETYNYVKAALTLFAGVFLGVAWGCLAKFAPHQDDSFATELRILLVLAGGLSCNFLTSMVGWGGTGGVAVLACNATAAMHWSRQDWKWKLNKNPVATAYRVLWSTLEPMVFAYTGTFFVIDSSSTHVLLLGLGILLACLTVRLAVTWISCWGFSSREKLYCCCTWVPKSIVEAVLCPVAINTLIRQPNHPEMEYADHLMTLIVQAIIITTPIGYLLTEHLGPILLSQKSLPCDNDDRAPRRNSSNGAHTEDLS